MNIYGRKEEQELLAECLKSNFPEFLAIYGRRRIGKTYLIREYFNNQFTFYATGLDQENKKKQLQAFHRSLLACGDRSQSAPKDWFEGFSRLIRLLESENARRDFGSQKMVVFLDEVPWMDTPKSDFKTALEWFWNSFGSARRDLLFIICGSATSWIIDNVFHNTGGLYNRVTRRIHLKPFTLTECEGFLRNQGFEMNRGQIIESYMVFGGVAYYLRLLSQRYSIHQDIERLIFSQDGQLRDEYQYLYTSLFRNSESYILVMKKLAACNNGLTRDEIAERTGMESGGQLTKILEELEACSFIRKYQNFASGSSKYVYQLMDAFTIFYFHFVESNKVTSWMDYIYSPGYYAWSGIAFERVCLLHSSKIREALKIAGVSSTEYAWRSKAATPGAQIDLVIDRKDDIIDLCEIKYTKEPFVLTEAVASELIRKREVFREETKSGKALHYVLISANGFSGTGAGIAAQHLITKDDLF